MGFAWERELGGQGIEPDDWLIEFEGDGVFGGGGIGGLLEIGRGDGVWGFFAVEIAFEEGLEEGGKFRPARERIVAGARWADAEGGENVEMGKEG